MTPNPGSTYSFRGRKIRISNLRIAAVLSLVLHVALLWSPAQKLVMDKLQPFQEKDDKEGQPAGSLAVRLVPPTSRHADETPQVPRAPVAHAPRVLASKPVTAPPKVAASPPVMTRSTPSPAPAVTPPQQMAGDLAAYIEQRRRARDPESAPAPAAPSAPAETQQERDNREAAERLGFNQIPTFGAGRRTGGGVFQIERMGYDSAEFFFFGWNKNIRRNAQQMIEVRKGDNPTMELAVVRKMIDIIREHSPGDFVWDSTRLRREVTLSARPADNAGLEEFLMREFFTDSRRR